jgi:hypothetical protein
MPPTDSTPLLSLDPSPSFNTYSSATLAQIAARVVREFTPDADSDSDRVFNFNPDESIHDDKPGNDDQQGGSDDFEFALVDSSLIAADDVFCNGQIRPVFPLFNTDLLLENAPVPEPDDSNSKPPAPRPVRKPLRKLFIEERETPSCSSSEADELDGIQPETYCVWKPRVPGGEENTGRPKKSNSTGSSKRWKFRDLLHRSNSSDGKDSFIYLSNKSSKNTAGMKEASARSLDDAKEKGKEGDRERSSFVPYKQDLVGLFANVSGLSRNMHPF